MANSPRHQINYKPRLTDLEAFDLLHPELKHALETSPFEWSASWVYRYAKTHNRKDTIKMLARANADEMKKAWWRGFPNPTHAVGLKPLRDTYSECRS